MKQKYVILRSENNTELTIKEYAELDKDVMSLLCEETYDNNRIEAAMKEKTSTFSMEKCLKKTYFDFLQ